MDLVALRQAVAERIKIATGLRTYAYAPDAFDAPCAIVYPGNDYVDNYHVTSGANGQVSINLIVVLMLSKSTDRAAQNKIDDYVSGLIQEAIEQVSTAPDGSVGSNLGLNHTAVWVTGASGVKTYELSADRIFYGVDFTLRVIQRKG